MLPPTRRLGIIWVAVRTLLRAVIMVTAGGLLALIVGVATSTTSYAETTSPLSRRPGRS